MGRLSSYYFHFLLFGFPIQSFIPFILGINSTPISIGFRILFVLIAILLIFLSSFKADNAKVHIGFIFMLLFWVVYSGRLIYDMEFMNVRYLETDKFYVYSFAFGVCLLPAIAAYKTANLFNIANSLKACFIILICSNLCLVYAILSTGNWNLSEILISRATVKVEIAGQTLSLINPISVGFHGELLALLSVFLINFPVWKSKFFHYMLYLALALGIFNLTLGASRGPMLAFVLILFFEVYLIGKYKKFNLSFFIKVFLLTVSIVAGAVIFINKKVDTEEVQLLSRFSDMYEERGEDGKEERDYEWQSAWNQFLRNPVVGDAFVNDYDRSYSHNIFLDVLMSTGLIGGTLFFTFFTFLMIKVRYITSQIKFRPLVAGYIVLFFTALISALVSGGIFNVYPFWLLSCFLLSYKIN